MNPTLIKLLRYLAMALQFVMTGLITALVVFTFVVDAPKEVITKFTTIILSVTIFYSVVFFTIRLEEMTQTIALLMHYSFGPDLTLDECMDKLDEHVRNHAEDFDLDDTLF